MLPHTPQDGGMTGGPFSGKDIVSFTARRQDASAHSEEAFAFVLSCAKRKLLDYVQREEEAWGGVVGWWAEKVAFRDDDPHKNAHRGISSSL